MKIPSGKRKGPGKVFPWLAAVGPHASQPSDSPLAMGQAELPLGRAHHQHIHAAPGLQGKQIINAPQLFYIFLKH